MFFNEPNRLPTELIIEIFDRLPPKDAISFLRVSKEMSSLVRNDNIWKKFGATDFKDFMERVGKLPRDYRSAVLNQEYDLPHAEELKLKDDIQMVLQLPLRQRFQKVQELLPEYNIPVEELNGDLYNHKQSIPMVTFLLMRLITPEQMNKIPYYNLMSLLVMEDGVRAFKNKVVTVADVMKTDPRTFDRFIKDRLDEFDEGDPSRKKTRT